MPSTKTSPTSENKTRSFDAQKELNRLYRRRMALTNLIRSVEEYLLVTDAGDTLLTESIASSPAQKKPNLRVVYSRMLQEMMA